MGEQKQLTGYPSIETTDTLIRDNFDDMYYPADIYAKITTDTNMKMIDFVRRANVGYEDTVSLLYFGLKITYREVFANVERYAKALKAAGLEKGDMITICLPNSPETLYYFYACNEIGVTPYLIDPRFTIKKIETCIEDSKSRLFICESGTFFSKVAGKADSLPVKTSVVVSPMFSFEQEKHLTLKQAAIKLLFRAKTNKAQRNSSAAKYIMQEAFLSAGKQYKGAYKSEYDQSIPAIIVNTSGTSGDSVKGAMHSNKSYNIISNQTDFITDGIKRGFSYYGYIPFFSMYGSGVGMHTALSHGVIIDLIPQFDGMKSIESILKKRINILIGVPSLFETIARLADERNLDMSFAKVFVMGGDNISPDRLNAINQSLQSHGMRDKIIYGYGSTEAGMMITTSNDERSHLYGSSGIPHTCVRIKILDPESKKQMKYGEEGEIYIHTPTLMMGYLNKPKDNANCFYKIDNIDYFKTGDKGYLTSTGHLFFTGRYKRLMKRPDGHQTSPIPIENSILKHPDVQDCAVVGLKRSLDLIGVIPTAFIQFKNGKETREALVDVISKSAENLSGEREMALAYTVVDKIPYTNNGKMDYRSLEAKDFSDGHFVVIDDPITKNYFKGLSNIEMIRL